MKFDTSIYIEIVIIEISTVQTTCSLLKCPIPICHSKVLFFFAFFMHTIIAGYSKKFCERLKKVLSLELFLVNV